MKKNDKLELYIKSLPMGKQEEIPAIRSGKLWRDNIRRVGKRMGFYISIIPYDGKYYALKMGPICHNP